MMSTSSSVPRVLCPDMPALGAAVGRDIVCGIPRPELTFCLGEGGASSGPAVEDECWRDMLGRSTEYWLPDETYAIPPIMGACTGRTAMD